MIYIDRDLGYRIRELAREYSCILLTGARQVGKTTLLRHLMGEERNWVTLDDLDERKLAKTDPALFLQLHQPPVLIDEVQYAPELFSAIKIAVDEGASPGSFLLTGSQSFHLMGLAQETLAGRVALLHLLSLSQHEVYGSGKNVPFTIDLAELRARKERGKCAEVMELYGRIWKGSMPAIISGKYSDWEVYYSSYVQTYVCRDIGDFIDRIDKPRFLDFIRAAACRSAQMLNVHDMARDVGVADDTAKRWLDLLEKSDLIFFLRSYSNNLLNRTVKTPKLYFFDTGLVAYLTKHLTVDTLANGALSGAILENYVVCEILKSYRNNARDASLYYYRDKDGNEIDLILENGGKLHPMEIKRSVNPGTEVIRAFKILDRSTLPRGDGAVVCLRPDLSVIDRQNYIVPVWMI